MVFVDELNRKKSFQNVDEYIDSCKKYIFKKLGIEIKGGATSEDDSWMD
jgi:hypothetical protein